MENYYITGTFKFTVSDNLCKRFEATCDVCKTRINRDIPYQYCVPQEGTDEYNQFNHKLNHDTREKQFAKDLGVSKHETMYQLLMKTWSSCIAYYKQMIVIRQGTTQYTNGYNIHEHRNCSKGKLKYLKA